MPFNFLTLEHYSVDYGKLFDEVNSNVILRDSEIQVQVVNAWITMLKKDDRVITDQLSTPESILELQNLMIKEPELFQLPMHHDGNDIYMHFRVHTINGLLEQFKNQYTDGNLSEFIDGGINWFPVELDDSYKPDLDYPIVMIPFHNNQYNFLVIDGNHRLSYCVKNNVKKIKVICLSEESVTESYLFASGFDKLYYTFMNEMNHMANATQYGDESPSVIVSKSYLNNGQLNFNRISN